LTVGLLFIWDESWFHPYAELTLWHDLAVSYNVELLIMVPDLRIYQFQDIKLEKYSTVEEGINAHPELTKVFLEPKSTADQNNIPCESLSTFDHPSNALYIFGNSGRTNTGLVNLDRGDKVVYVPTLTDKQIWSVECAGIVLYDRCKKAWLI
jgi:hypothetical protein